MVTPNTGTHPSASLLDEVDLALRAPILSSVRQEENQTHHRIRPMLYRMYIACHILQLGYEARFTALVLFHRYTRAVKGDGADPTWAAASCLFLACKAEEEPRRLRDVINLAHMLLSTSRDESAHIVLKIEPPHLNEDYWDAKKKIVETEQIVLRWLAFDVSVSHPHRAVSLILEKDELVRDKIVPIAFRRLNDALFHGPALEHLALEMACAAIELARVEIEIGNVTLFKGRWWGKFNVSNEALEETKKHLNEATYLLKQCANGIE